MKLLGFHQYHSLRRSVEESSSISSASTTVATVVDKKDKTKPKLLDTMTTTASATAPLSIPIYLHYMADESSSLLSLQALIEPSHTLAQLKQAARRAFHVPADQAILLHIVQEQEQQEQEDHDTTRIALHDMVRNHHVIAPYLQPHAVVQVTVAPRDDSTTARRQGQGRKTSPRFLKLTKHVQQSWKRNRQQRQASSSLAGITQDDSFRTASTTTTTIARPASTSQLPVVDVVVDTAATTTTTPQQPPQERHVVSSSMRSVVSLTEIPTAFLCPISLELMADPVTAQDGVTYDRTVIEAHFQTICQTAAEREQQQEEENDLEGNPNPAVEHDDDDDEEDSIPPMPLLHHAPSRRFTNALLWSPMTREIISPALVPNRAIEQMIEEAVERGTLPLSDADVQDWYERRAQKMQRDRFQRSQQARVMSSSSSLPDSVSVPNSSSSSEDEGDEDHEDSNNHEDHDCNTVPQDGISSNVLCQLVRLDRPNEQDRLGPHDSGLATVVAVNPTTTTTTLPRRFCAVGCCVARLAQDNDPEDQDDETCVPARHCHRCQRTVCRDCRRTQVTDIRTGSNFKPYEICLECVWQLAEVVNEDTTTTLLHDVVLPRLEACWQQVVHDDLRQWHQQAHAMSNCTALEKDIQETLSKAYGLVPDDNGQEEGKRNESLSSSCCLLDKSQSEEHALGYYPATHSSLPLGLCFPTPAMRNLVQVFQQERSALEYKWRPVIATQVHEQESRLANLYKQCQKQVAALTDSDDHEQVVMEVAEQLRCIVNDSTQQLSLKDRQKSNDSLFIKEEVCQFVPPPEKRVAPRQCTLTLRMCPFCRAGPFHQMPTSGCGNCGGGRADDFDRWPCWDEVAGPH